MKKLMLLILAMSLPLFAQTTTTYQITNSTSQGKVSSPWRAFNIPLTEGAQVNWLEVGASTACTGQSAPFLGFVFLSMVDNGQTCLPLTVSTFSGSSPGVVYSGRLYCAGSSYPVQLDISFSGYDSTNLPVSGTASLHISYYYSSARYGGCYERLDSGAVNMTE